MNTLEVTQRTNLFVVNAEGTLVATGLSGCICRAAGPDQMSVSEVTGWSFYFLTTSFGMAKTLTVELHSKRQP